MRIYEIMEDDKFYYIISELLEGGELYDRIIRKKRFSERDAAVIIHQILLALNYMHQRQIVHRDIKPENILFEKADQNESLIKITDFGFANFLDPNEESLTDTLGSPLYMAPEIVKKVKYNTKVDIWSLGVLTYIMLSGKPPFNGKTKEEIFLQLLSQTIQYSDPIWSKLSNQAVNFVKSCLTRDQRFRPSADELLNHEWIQSNLTNEDIEVEHLEEIS